MGTESSFNFLWTQIVQKNKEENFSFPPSCHQSFLLLPKLFDVSFLQCIIYIDESTATGVLWVCSLRGCEWALEPKVPLGIYNTKRFLLALQFSTPLRVMYHLPLKSPSLLQGVSIGHLLN